MRFRFPDGLPGEFISVSSPPCLTHNHPGHIVCEAHNDHFVGVAKGSTSVLDQFNTFQDEDRAATAEAGDKGIIIHFGDQYYGRTNLIGTPVSQADAQEWDVREISMVPL